MGHVEYTFLKGRVLDFAKAPVGNPHLWVVVEANGTNYFATINVHSSKNAANSPVAASYLYFTIDNDFRHPIATSLVARPEGFQRAERSFAAGALDYVKGNLFDPRTLRVLVEGAGGDGLVQRLSAQLQIARENEYEIMIFGSQFRTKPHQIDAAFPSMGTPALGIDNIHMAQGDPTRIDHQIHENGAWHDGGAFLRDPSTGRITAIFLAFQTQSWQTDEEGQPIDGRTGYEAPQFDFSSGSPVSLPAPRPVAELTSLVRLSRGGGKLVVANLSNSDLSLDGWSVIPGGMAPIPLPPATLTPGQPLSVDLSQDAIFDKGGILTLADAEGLKVDGVSYLGGSGTDGWGTSFG